MAKNVRKERDNIEKEEGISFFWRKTQNKEVANNLGVPGRREARFAPKRPARDSPRLWYPPSVVFVFSQWVDNLAGAGGELTPNRLEACCTYRHAIGPVGLGHQRGGAKEPSN